MYKKYCAYGMHPKPEILINIYRLSLPWKIMTNMRVKNNVQMSASISTTIDFHFKFLSGTQEYVYILNCTQKCFLLTLLWAIIPHSWHLEAFLAKGMLSRQPAHRIALIWRPDCHLQQCVCNYSHCTVYITGKVTIWQ